MVSGEIMNTKNSILLILILIVILIIVCIKSASPEYKPVGVYKLVAVIPEIDTKIYEVEIDGKICGVAASNSFGSGNYAIAISCP